MGGSFRPARRLSNLTKRALGFSCDGVDCLSTRAAVVVIDPKPLIMAAHETGTDQIGNGAAHAASPGLTKSFAKLVGYGFLGGIPLIGHGAACLEIGAHLRNNGFAAPVAVGQWKQCIA